jgi:hypothetical protein
VSALVRLHPTNIRAIQQAFGPICYDTASRQPSAVTEGLPDTRSGGGAYEVSAIRTGCWLVNVCYGRDAAKHSVRGGNRKQIPAQPRPPTLECSEAYLPISGWHTRLRHQIRTEQTLRPSGLHRLGLRGLSRHLEIDAEYFFRFGTGAISWRSKLQDCTATGTTEAEYVAASDAAKEALWLGRLARTFLQCNSKWIPTVFSDNQGALALAENPIHHNASKHIEVRYHFVRDCATKEMLSLEKVSTTDNVADVMTRSLSTDRFRSLRNRMGVELISD